MDAFAGVTVTRTFGTSVKLAATDFVGSAALIAVTVTVAGEGATEGAEKTADDALVASVPQVGPLHPAPLKLQVTAVFDVPATLVAKGCIPEVGTEALAGLILNESLVIEGVTVTPVPVIVIVSICVVTMGAVGTLAKLTRGDLNRLLVIERLPETVPIEDGTKLVVKVAPCPPANVNGSGGPLTVKSLPDVTAWMRVKASVPELARVRL